jgi:hypothetical protein
VVPESEEDFLRDVFRLFSVSEEVVGESEYPVLVLMDVLLELSMSHVVPRSRMRRFRVAVRLPGETHVSGERLQPLGTYMPALRARFNG